MDFLLVSLVAFLPVIMWFFLWRKQDKEKEPLKAMMWCFLLGALAIVPFFFIYLIFPGIDLWFGDTTFSIFFFAFIEEVLKGLMLILAIEISRRWFTQIVDGLIYGAAIGLGFAFVENILYLIPLPIFGTEFIILYFLRSLDTMVAHTLFTGFFGFFYASAYLRKEVFPKKKREKPWYRFFTNIWEALPFHVTLFHILPNRPSKKGHYPGSLIVEGLMLASLLHAFFNVLMWEDLGAFSFPLVFILAYIVWRMFLQKVYIKVVHKVKR